MVAPLSTTTRSGSGAPECGPNKKRGLLARAFASSLNVRLELLADRAVDRIRAAAADGEVEAHEAKEHDVLIAAAADCEALGPVRREHRDQEFDGEGRCEEA